jgi:hypothetical protein
MNPQQAMMIKPEITALVRMSSPSVSRLHKGRVHHLSEIFHFRASQDNKTGIDSIGQKEPIAACLETFPPSCV